MLCGLFIAGCGSALTNDWRGFAVAWDEIDSRFPPAFRTPASFAGVALLAFGAVVSLLPVLP